ILGSPPARSCPLCLYSSLLRIRRPPGYTLFPYTTLFRSCACASTPTTATVASCPAMRWTTTAPWRCCLKPPCPTPRRGRTWWPRSEEHTSELQSRFDLVCRLLLEKKNQQESSASPAGNGI